MFIILEEENGKHWSRNSIIREQGLCALIYIPAWETVFHWMIREKQKLLRDPSIKTKFMS